MFDQSLVDAGKSALMAFWNQFRGWIILAVLIVVGMLLYSCEHKIALDASNQSQLLKGQIQIKVEEANEAKKKAEAADLKAVALAKTVQEAEQKTLSEHVKTQALKAKLAALGGGLSPLPTLPSSDPVVLRDQVINQQEIEIQSQQVEIKGLKEEVDALSVKADSYKQSSDDFEAALKLSEKRVRAEQIAREAVERSGMLREAKGGLEGAALMVVLHVLKVL
jgi:hypothetical protein